jgi:putative resolvase
MDKDFYTPQEIVTSRLLSVEQVAKRLQFSKMTIYRYIKAGRLEAYKIGKEYRIKEADLERFLEGVKIE